MKVGAWRKFGKYRWQYLGMVEERMRFVRYENGRRAQYLYKRPEDVK